MIRVFLIVVAFGVLLLAGGVVYLGMFPPNPPQHAVEKTLPNDKFQTQAPAPTQAQTAPTEAQTAPLPQTQTPPAAQTRAQLPAQTATQPQPSAQPRPPGQPQPQPTH